MQRHRLPRLLRQLERHVVSSILTGAGVMLLAAGLFAYVMPLGAAATPPSAPPVGGAGSPSVPSSLGPPVTPTASPGGSPSASAVTPASPAASDAVATRVVIPALKIDLPVVPPRPNETFPLCGVAEYWLGPGGTPTYVQPGQPGTAYLFAHARAGMFLPLLTASQSANGAGMIGYSVLVYTGDSKVYWYSIAVVNRGLPYDDVAPPPMAHGATQQLVLQTSEGPYTTSTKLRVVATLVLVQPATFAASHPTPHPQVCA
jgi:hypothetical protein